MLGYRGKTFNIDSEQLGKITSCKHDREGTSYLIEFAKHAHDHEQFGLVRCGKPVIGLYSSPSFLCPQDIKLCFGDVVRITKSGSLFVLFSAQSNDNCLFVTNSCNSHCIMCPQPPRVDTTDHYEEAKQIVSLIETPPDVIGITGGEPLLKYDSLIELLKLIKKRFPATQIQLLTNARLLKDKVKALEVVDIAGDDIVFCIPLYADNSVMHDMIVSVQGAFFETMEALHHLGRLKARIELRYVPTKQNASRLQDWSLFVCKNLPFVEHVAIMGIEPIGLAHSNYDQVWIDPVDYATQLTLAVFQLTTFGLTTSLFNHQLCTIPEELWEFSVNSISDWKVQYLSCCTECEVSNRCGGLFFASKKRHSIGIHPIKNAGVINE
ncbi:His-Xaa-Ser system radical SAM maturase HxsC [Halodesulfovibrio sp.]|jgi:His-Xaa-Ser system radical SAM maturase HxsC|uniref:His-Xaa-Ser system radical SAM maturase HxsC n=1 Tax=Halodesulfovibrio sp. TaxID=1912772 RepID=UPI0025D2176E|nr:His-Xaa-Ser system radical SAM maturase HxsC [Halodesulfovibrio sp.]MCT4625683.1 His-Xaa-Ser system radical SAM maturase HxsC [Halodesulfovibrio sp.]